MDKKDSVDVTERCLYGKTVPKVKDVDVWKKCKGGRETGERRKTMFVEEKGRR